MSVGAWERVKDLLHRAMQLRPEERSSFLDQACGSDASLRAEIDSLLSAGNEVRSGFLGSTAGRMLGETADSIAAGITLTEGQLFAERFRLVRKLGEGGMGQVWLAEQIAPVRRQVALKLIKAGMHDESVVQRFQAERQSLAIMDHPAIARVFDAGATPQGQPYFVMEYVPGISITDYCDQHRLEIRKRVELFIQACEGVQHAHQKAILHRDLKPANILVVELDGRPTPRIIDFGLARTTAPRTGDESMVTAMWHFVGTPGYMSPEQAGLNSRDGARDIDTRTDVYSMGVVLYVLLAGSQPFESKQGKKPALDELLRMLREDDAPRLSNRISSSKYSIDTVAEARAATPRQLVAALRGDLDWITMKALERDRGRRYASVAELAADLRRYSSHEPIVARPPSARYQFAKFVARNRVLAGGVAAVLVVLLAGIATSTIFAVRARRAQQDALSERDRAVQAEEHTREQRDRATSAEQAANSQRDLAVAAQQSAVREQNRALAETRRADEQATTATAEANFLEKDLLSQAGARGQVRAGTKPDPEMKVRTLLDRAAAKIEGKFEKQPVVEASLRLSIGEAYRELVDYAEAQRHVERAIELRRKTLGDDNPDTLAAERDLALLYERQAKYKEAIAQFNRVLGAQRRVLGAANAETAQTAYELGSTEDEAGDFQHAETDLTQALDVQRRLLGEEHADTLLTAGRLGGVYRNEKKLPQAESLIQKTLETQKHALGQDHPDTLISMQHLGLVYWDEAKYAEAEALLSKALEGERRQLGEDQRETLTGMGYLALIYDAEGKYADAETLLAKELAIKQRILGDEDRDTVATLKTLGLEYWQDGRYKEAEPYTEETAEITRRQQGADDADTLDAENNLATLYLYEGRFGDAEPLFSRILEVRRKKLGDEHADTLASMINLASLYADQGRYPEAETLSAKALEGCRRKLGEEDANTLAAMQQLGQVYRFEKKHQVAEPLVTRAAEANKKIFGAESTNTLDAMEELASLRRDEGKPAEAEALFATVLEGRRRVLRADHPDTLGAMMSLAEVRLKQKNYAGAEPLLREALAAYAKSDPESWQRYASESMLGATLAAEQKFAEAEPMLLEGYRGLNARRSSTPFEERATIGETSQRIVELYESWGQASKAEEWRATVAKR